jgi:hypothetical protein
MNLASPRQSSNNAKPNNAKPNNTNKIAMPSSFTEVPKSINQSKPSFTNNRLASINHTISSAVNNKSLSAMFSPIQDSVAQSAENVSDFVSIPVMIGIGILIIALIIITIFRDQVAYGLQVAWNYVKNAFSPSPPPAPMPDAPQIDTGAIKNMIPMKEVFNVADNKYKYSDAEPLCKAYGAELATYDQVKDAWNKGADWCNYGWVKGQAAIYPTQESTYQKLQAGPEDQKGACGIPGVNGGYFDNPDLRFGVNCYGSKPGKSDADERAQRKPRNMTNDGLEYDRKVQDYKSKLNQIPLSPFNSTSWA